jgi:hypothetical protein
MMVVLTGLSPTGHQWSAPSHITVNRDMAETKKQADSKPFYWHSVS